MNPHGLRSVLFSLLITSLCLAGCGSAPFMRRVQNEIAQGNNTAAFELIQKNEAAYAGSSDLLYYLDLGAVAQRAGDYAASNAALEKADRLIEQLYGTSVTEAATSMLVNDTSLSYSGEDYEQVMVNILKLLNYLYLGQVSEALIEARMANTRLTKLADQYGSKAVYKKDGLASYLGGFAFEAEGEYNDAYIDYKYAYQAFEQYGAQFGMPMPILVKHDLLRLSRKLGFSEDYAHWKELFSDLPEEPLLKKKTTEVLLVVYDGLAPQKRSRYIYASIEDPDGNPYNLRVAFPAYVPSPAVVEGARIGLAAGVVADTCVLEPVNDIAIQTLEQRIALISAKAIARATAKYHAAYLAKKAAKEASDEASGWVGLIANVYNWVSEEADTRSWMSLPNRFHIARLTLPPGKQTVQIGVQSMQGARPLVTVDLNLKPGEKKVIPIYIPQ